MQTTEFLAAAGPLIGASGSGFYFAEESLAAGQELGLDPLHLYYLGRGGVLGDAPAAVVHCAFGGYFATGFIERIWNEARRIAEPGPTAARYFECSAELGRRLFVGVDLGPARAALERVVDTSPTSGLPLFRGLVALPAVGDDAGRTMQLLTVLREQRGDAHLVSMLALGVDPRAAHYFRRPDYYEAFGWGPADIPVLAGDEETRLAEVENLTDAILTPSFAAVPESDRATLLTVLQALHDRLRSAGRGTELVAAPGRS